MFLRVARRSTIWVVLATVGLVAAILTGCSGIPNAHAGVHPLRELARAGAARIFPTQILNNVQFGAADGQPLLLDLCLPVEPTAVATPRPAVILVHGGSWTHGDKSEWDGICQWMASSGYVAASIGYRLAPAHIFPAGIDDIETAVRWLRDPAQTAKYAIDPARVGAFGGSAGGNLVSLLGVSGTGPTNAGDRVQAVVELSAPIDLTSGGLEQTAFYPYELRYLGCASYAQCPQAVAASPIFHVASTDPPFFVAQSTNERIPLVQSQRFVAALRAVHVPTTFVTRPGDRHSVAILDPLLRLDILDFLKSTLGDPSAAAAKS
jgi:acetyl esterase